MLEKFCESSSVTSSQDVDIFINKKIFILHLDRFLYSTCFCFTEAPRIAWSSVSEGNLFSVGLSLFVTLVGVTIFRSALGPLRTSKVTHQISPKATERESRLNEHKQIQCCLELFNACSVVFTESFNDTVDVLSCT